MPEVHLAFKRCGRPARAALVLAVMLAGCTPSEERQGSPPDAELTTVTKSVAGVTQVHVSLEQRSARVRYRSGTTSPERLAASIDSLGYRTGTPIEEAP